MSIVKDKIITTWTYANKERYEGLGYEFTGFGTHLWVKVAELPENSREMIEVECEDCGNVREVRYDNYVRSIKKGNRGICSHCSLVARSKLARGPRKPAKEKVEEVLTLDVIIKNAGDDGISFVDLVREASHLQIGLGEFLGTIKELESAGKIAHNKEQNRFFWEEEEEATTTDFPYPKEVVIGVLEAVLAEWKKK